MTGAFEGRGPRTARMRSERLESLGVRDGQVLYTTAGLPDQLLESHLEAWSYTPDFTGLVQILLERLQSERNLAIAVCGAPADSRARAHTALQLSIGLTQHGRGVAVVDADASLPGLAGLVRDPHAEGLIDMVRFGRSCRSLLWKPLQTGPAVLPLGSFPLRGRLPFDADAVRGVLHRVALHTDVALYVAPLVEGEVLHPIVHACGQAVYVQGPESSTEAAETELSTWVGRGTVSLVGLVVHEAEAPADTGVAESVAGSIAPAVASGAAPEPAPPTDVDWGAGEAADAEAATPKFEMADVQSALEALEPQDEAQAPRASRAAAAWPARKKNDPVQRTPSEAREVREMLRLGETEFAYDEQVSYSRTPLYLLITLVILIGGFLGWVLWTERGIQNRRVTPPNRASTGAAPAGETPSGSVPPESAGSGAGDDPLSGMVPPVEPGTDPVTTTPEGAATEGDAAAADPTASVEPPVDTQAAGSPTDREASAAAAPESAATPTQQDTPPPSPPPSGVSYTVHVASYQQAQRAQADVDNLAKHGFEARAIRTDLGSKGIWYRVYVGSYPSRADADRARTAVLKLPGYSFAQVRRAPTP